MKKVKVKFLGNKSPFIYENEHLISKKIQWSKKGSIVEIPVEDAEFLQKWSKQDFEIIKEVEPEPVPVDEKKDDIEKDDDEAEKRRDAVIKKVKKIKEDAPKKED